MDNQPPLICIIVQRHLDDQRVRQWFDLLASRCVVYLVSGTLGESLRLLTNESLGSVENDDWLTPSKFDTKADFVLLHGGDSGGINDCWSGAKKMLSSFDGPVFLYDSPGTPSVPDNDHHYFTIRRGTKPLFEIADSHIEELVQFVKCGNPVPSCCKERPNFLIALKLLCQCHEMGIFSEPELRARGIKNTQSLTLAASWFMNAKNWQVVLNNEFLDASKHEFCPTGISSYLSAIADLSRDQTSTENSERKWGESEPVGERCGSDLRALVCGLSFEIDKELKKYA